MTKALRSPAKTTTPEKAAALKEALVGGAKSLRTRRSLERVWDALETMRKGGGKDFRIVVVAKQLGPEGPAEQSIRNTSGRVYQQLIEAYAEEVAPLKQPALSGDDDALVHQIDDPTLAARVGAVLAQNRALRRRNDILHSQFARLADVTASPATAGALALPATMAPHDFTADEIKAVRRFIRGVDKHNWEWEEETGSILDQRGNEIAPPYFLDALRRIVGGAATLPDRV